MTQKSSLIPELKVSNFRQSIEFYTDLAGFKILYERIENGFAMLEIQGAQLMIEALTSKNRLWSVGEMEKPFGRGIHFQIEVEDIQYVYETFKKANYPLFLEMEETWYRMNEKEVCNKQFLVQDPDGYLLRFFEPIGTRQV